jgi:photosystem II stability/assembly factor-like uncharacterized protein
MRPFLAALLAGAALTGTVRGSDLRNFDDAALRAVQFVDGNEGWAVGDEGVVWHTIDGGTSWDRQPTGVRASLRSLHFLNPYTGWVAGREELPHGAGSVGVLLFTRDGGLKWQRAGLNAFPGLNRVRFVDDRTGFVVGDGTEQYPSGMFTTQDGGRSWKPVPGPRCPAWLAADFQDGQTAALAGAWSRLATLRQGTLTTADVDTLGGRSLYGLQLVGNRGVAVGEGGLVLLSKDSAGARWGYADLQLPPEVRAGWDFHALHCVGDRIWVAGRPGSALLYSADAGRTWEVRTTGQPLPLHGLFFLDEQHGWAVGDLGCVLATANGGKTWRVQRRGGQRAAVLFVHARPAGVPLDTMARLGGEEGYLAAAVRVLASDPGSAAPERASEAQRFAAAVRRAGGAAGETLWQFPVPQYLVRSDRRALLGAWDRLHGDRAAEQLLRQLVLALRIWRPQVIITDYPDAQADGFPAEALVAEALHEAFTRAADPKAFPEQIEVLGLEPWQAGKLYACWKGQAGAQVALDGTHPGPRLEASPRDFADTACSLLFDSPADLPAQRFYRLLDSRLDGAEAHRDLMQGVTLGEVGVARRAVAPVAELSREKAKALQARRQFQTIVQTVATSDDRPGTASLGDPSRVVAQVGPALAGLPDDQAAPAAFALANQYVRLGQWPLAREIFLLLVDRYPAHPLAADAYRWLVRYHASSEARRRNELKQFLMLSSTDFHPIQAAPPPRPEPGPTTEPPGERKPDGKPPAAGPALISAPKMEVQVAGQLALLKGGTAMRQWYQASIDAGDRFASLGPLFANDPPVQFCVQAARRNLGEFDAARQWYTEFRQSSADGPWHDAAAAEVWLVNRSGPPPKPVAPCRRTDLRPFLDGQFDDSCWRDLKPLVLRNAVGATVRDYPTEVWLAYDQDFLYVALRCRHPADRYVAPVKVRPRDADLRPYDRVSLLLDLDRDYSTYFHLQVDQRGCVCDDCWGDLTWDPRWFVALHSDRECWQVEAAIPLVELTGEPIPAGHAWACNVVRVLPGRGVQAWSLPADVQPRPEGMGLLIFTQEQAPKNADARH